MKLKKVSLSILFLLIGVIATAQELKDAVVMGVIPIGNNYFAIINDVESNISYKTSAYKNDELDTNQPLQLLFTNDNGIRIEVISRILTERVYVHEIGNTANILTTSPAFRMPILENDILFFESEAHINECMILIENYIDHDNTNTDDMLDNIEELYIGYTSYRTWFNTEYDWLNGSFTTEQLIATAKLDFLNDDIFKTLLNENKLIGVGSTVHCIEAPGISVSCDKTNLAAIQAISAIGDKYGKVTSDLLLEVSKYDLDLFIDGEEHSPPKGKHIVTETLQYVTENLITDLNCNTYDKKLQIHMYEEVLDASTGNFVRCLMQWKYQKKITQF